MKDRITVEEEALTLPHQQHMHIEVITTTQDEIQENLDLINRDFYSFSNRYHEILNLPTAQVTLDRIVRLQDSVNEFIKSKHAGFMNTLDNFCKWIGNLWVPDCVKEWRDAHTVQETLAKQKSSLQSSSSNAHNINQSIDAMLKNPSLSSHVKSQLSEAEHEHQRAMQEVDPAKSPKTSMQAYLEQIEKYSIENPLSNQASRLAQVKNSLDTHELEEIQEYIDIDEESVVDPVFSQDEIDELNDFFEQVSHYLVKDYSHPWL